MQKYSSTGRRFQWYLPTKLPVSYGLMDKIHRKILLTPLLFIHKQPLETCTFCCSVSACDDVTGVGGVTRDTWPAWRGGWTAAINSGGPSLVCDGQWRVIFLWWAVSLLWTAPGFCGGQEDITKYSSWGLLNIHLCLGRYSKRSGGRAFVLGVIGDRRRKNLDFVNFTPRGNLFSINCYW